MHGSRRAQIAITALVELAMQKRGVVPLSRLTRQVPASISYLEQIFASLRRRGLVTGFRGTGGGYRLDRPADEISVADVMEALDSPGLADITGTPNRHGEAWHELLRQVQSHLRGITIANLLERRVSHVLAA
ncbi:MAG: Rrf2 family transcriptional regulator [Acidiferrobacterales bacterium]|nr:Rrf2 family transcriptional regulator [Acidiferrobacterales bacterium]